MAVGKGSMERASKAVKKESVKEHVVPGVEKKTIVAGMSKQVMEQVETQKNSQILDREADKNENFGIGDAMPIYLF